jgi:hypothetical protein
MRANRWQLLLSANKQLPVGKVFWANMAGYLGNNVLPARAGELIRAVYVGKENDIPISFALATGLVERFMDLIALVIIGSIALASVGIISGQLEVALKVMTIIAIVGLVALLLIPRLGYKVIHSIPFPHRIKPSAREKFEEFLKQFLQGIEALQHPVRAGIFILFTCLIWLMDGVGTVILARSMSQNLTLIESLLLLAGLGLSSAIPSTPGYVGIYQFAAVVILQPLGITNANALAIIIFLQAMGMLVIVTWGGLAALRTSKFLQRQG